MKFPILNSFLDTQDEKRLNQKNKFYPREGLKPTKSRIKELQDKGFIGDEVGEPGAQDFPKHTGGGYYELSNGEKVQGKEAAFEAEAAIKAGDV